MTRAAVLIGVDKTGDLPRLNDAAKGAERMAGWARAQGIDRVEVFTDAQGPVDAQAIKKAVFRLVDSDVIEQLFVYFAGHGTNVGRSEFWQLTDAPRDTQAAINVGASAESAAFSGIPHVVFISDACRTAAVGLRAQRIDGTDLFPNDGGGRMLPVDRFYACLLGRPALEIADAATTTKEYSAVYTAALLDALQGAVPSVLEPAAETGFELVRPRPLRDHLHDEVTRRITAKRLATAVTQEPDAVITSEGTAWIARVAALRRRRRGRAAAPPPAPPAPQLLTSLLTPALAGDPTGVTDALSAPAVAPERADRIAVDVARTEPSFGPGHHETACGFKLRGERIIEAFATRAGVAVVAPDDVRVDPGVPGATVLLRFQGGTAAALPAVAGFIAGLTFSDGELADVAYEPSDNTSEWGRFAPQVPELRLLRAVAASATRDGIFRLEGAGADALLSRLTAAEGLDPTLALYAAYPLREAHRVGDVRGLAAELANAGSLLFDVAMLSGDLDRVPDPAVHGFAPLLAQGWPLLRAMRVTLPPALAGLHRHVVQSTWTLLDAAGARLVQQAMQQGDIP
jgi:hypothetical protein